MNTFLISVAAYVPELNPLAKSTALSVGKVSVNMGETACQVPYAPDYIAKIEQRGKVGVKRKTLVC